MALNLPDIYTAIAFNAEPFDPSGIPIWIDFSARYYGTGSATRGRSQYELGQGQTAQADVTWNDVDEALNPANPTSAYAPNVVPYRPLLWRAMWPAGGTGNVLGGAGQDGSLESYPAVTNQPPWLVPLTNLFGTNVTTVGVLSGVAWQGTKSAQLFCNFSTTVPGGASFTLPLIPGRQYTAQAHINQSLVHPFILAVDNQTITVDPFNRTVAANSGWGTPTSPLGFGSAWVSSPSNTGFSVTPGFAFMSQSAVNARMTMFTGDRATNHAVYDVDQWVTVNIPVVATGQAIQAILYARYIDASNNLAYLISFNTDLTVTVTAQKLVAGVTTTIGTNATLPGNYAAGDNFRMHMKLQGPDIWLKAWKVNTPVPEPSPWTTQGSDNAVTTPGTLGVSTILTTGNTNTLPVVLTFSDYRAIGSTVDTVNGTTAVSGSYALITQTFTATQPTHTFNLQLRSGPSFSTVTIQVDGLQVEPGATANTFTTVGPTIRSPWTRGYVERFPIQWDPDSNGFLGVMSGPVVGPGFQLNGAILHTEYVGALLAKSPLYYWRLNESASSATVFGDQSGNGGTSLYRYDGVEGPATAFTPGSASGITGDPNGVGVLIGPSTGAPSPGPATILSTNQWGLGRALSGLGGTGLAWGVTISLWMSSPNPTIATTSGSLVFALQGNTSDPTSCQILVAMILLPSGTPGPDLQFGNNVAGITFGRPAGTSTGLDGNPHHYVFTINFANNNINLSVYRDGVVYGTPSNTNVSATFGSTTLNANFILPSMAGSINPSGSSTSINSGIYGTYEHLALFNRALTAADVADLYRAGQGYPNENSGTRVARYVALAGYTGGVDVQQGMTQMGSSVLAEGTTALAAIQGVQDTEFGVFYESQEGVAFRGRQARYLAVTPAYVFGENVAGGEYPYTGTPAYDDDATYVFNNATITRSNGAIATATDLTGKSQMRYGSRTFTRTVGGNNDLEAQDAANYVVANSKDARPRVVAVTFDAGATRGVTASPDGTLWPMLLSLEVGTRVTLNRRAKAAAGGTLTMSSDFFIEGITPNSINEAQGTFLVTLLMSPAPVTAQPWILEDATYGQLDVTTVLGF